ncbi:MAG TPA: hypothetical protein PKE52_05485, partial [Bacteroidales bacterium]|nr:hypothetical protein [Bacteroidales bacterium]
MKSFFSILFVVLAIYVNAAEENDSILNLKLNDALELKESGLRQIENINDSMKGVSFSNLIGLLNGYKLVARADSTINVIYADLYTDQVSKHKNLITKLASLGINPEKPILKPNSNNGGWSIYGFFILLVLLLAISFFAVKLYMKQKEQIKEQKELKSMPTADEILQQTNEEYEHRLHEISSMLTEMTLQHNNTAAEIENLNRVLAKERQTRIAYSEQYEKVADELNKLKARNDLWPSIANSTKGDTSVASIQEIEKLQTEICDLKAGKFALEQQLKEALLKLASNQEINIPDPKIVSTEFQENEELKTTIQTLRSTLKESVTEGENLRVELSSLRKEIESLKEKEFQSAQAQGRIEQLESE